MKRLLVCLLCFVLLFSAVACNEPDSNIVVDTDILYDAMHGVDTKSEKLVVVDAGKTDYKIVVSDNATEAENFAASELSNFIKQITGVTLPIINDKNTENDFSNKYFSVGKTDLLEYAKTSSLYSCDYSKLNGDGFVIKTVQNTVLFDGANDRGVLYSVYDFLEKFCGVKFITSDYTYVPQMREIKTYQMEVVEVPEFKIRNYLSTNVSSDPLFSARVRFVSDYGKNEAQYGYGFLEDFYNSDPHNFFDLVTKDEYYVEHPEWFGVNNDSTELCLTNGIKDYHMDTDKEESVVKAVIEKLKVWMTEKPNAKYFYVCQEDNGEPCRCEKCLQSDNNNGGVSGTLMVFLNVISEELQKWIDETNPSREFYLVTFAYQYTINPPTDIVKGKVVPYNEHVVARDNVIIRIAPIEQCYYHPFDDETCNRNGSMMQCFEGWSTIASKMFIWDYSSNYTEYLWYYPNLSSVKSNLQLYKDLGVIYVMTQGGHKERNLYQDRLKVYVYSKLMWNYNRNVWELVSEFNRYYFGEEAGGIIDEFINLAETHYAILNETKSGGFHSHVYTGLGFLDSTYYDKAYLEKLLYKVESAMDSVNKNSDYTQDEKSVLTKRLLSVYIIPQRMILRNYVAYYPESTKAAFMKSFVDNCEKVGIVYLAEVYTLSKFREENKI